MHSKLKEDNKETIEPLLNKILRDTKEVEAPFTK